MNYLYIDTSSSYLYTGIVSNNSLIAYCNKELGHDMSKFALASIEQMFDKSGLKPDDIDKIIVVSGPGSFTGIRIGMTFAKIFAWSKNIEITSITSLDAMATSTTSSKIKVPIIDARRGYVYSGVYYDEKILLSNKYIKLADLITYLDTLNDEYVFITNDIKYKEYFHQKYNPDILKIINRYKDKEAINPHKIEPTYLKLTEAEENLKEVVYDKETN